MPEPAIEWVEMRHPAVHISDDIESATVSRAAYDAVWKDKEWELVVDQPTAEASPTGPAARRTPSTTIPTTPEA